MYFIQHKTKFLYLHAKGMATVSHMLQKNYSLITMDTPAKGKKVLLKVQSLFTEKERGHLQLVKEKTFQEAVKTKVNQKSTARITQSLEGQITQAMKELQNQCSQVDSSQYCPLPVQAKPKTLANVNTNPPAVLIPPVAVPLPPKEEGDLVVDCQEIDNKTIISAPSLASNQFRQKLQETLESLSQLMDYARDSRLDYNMNMKQIENKIIDELHFIEFEPCDQANSQQVYETLHDLRQERRKLKDDYVLSGIIDSLFVNVSQSKIQAQIERIQKMEHRGYVLRAPGEHEKRGL